MEVPLKFHCIIIPDSDSATPIVLQSDTLDALKAEMYQKLIDTKLGWCYIFNGERMHLTSARQVFSLKMPDDTLVEIKDPTGTVFDSNGRFTTLHPVD